MRRFYQEGWQGIQFTAFTHVSFFRLAQPKFYATFYEELFRRYTAWSDLPAAWRQTKEGNARWLAQMLQAMREAHPKPATDPQRVLSIGCGVGYLEKCLLDMQPEVELHLNDLSTAGLRWLRDSVPSEHMYIGMPPNCLPSSVRYDIIYLANIDHVVPTRQMVRLLEELRAQLLPGGRIVCLSSSLLEEDNNFGKAVNCLKIALRAVLHILGLRRQQFWGWRRTREEYQEIFHAAGLVNVEDGLLDEGVAEPGFETYFICGEE